MKRLQAMVNIVRKLYSRQPTAISFNVTHRCNLKCIMCQIHQTKVAEMDIPMIGRIMSDLKDAGFQIIEITGGEPFLRKDIFDILALLDDRDFRYTINTNGILLTRDVVEGLKKCRGILQIAVSIDSLKADVFARIRGLDKLDEVLEGLFTLQQYGPDVPIKTNLTLNRFNYREIDDYLDFCKKHGLYLSVFPVNLGSNFRHRSLDEQLLPLDHEKEEMARTFYRIAALRKKGEPFWEHSSFYENAVSYILFNSVRPCDAGKLFYDLHTDGKIAVCNDLPPFGDLTRETFSDCHARFSAQKKMIQDCYEQHPCYYTCTYAISAISQHKFSYVMENMKMMGLKKFIRNFIANS